MLPLNFESLRLYQILEDVYIRFIFHDCIMVGARSIARYLANQQLTMLPLNLSIFSVVNLDELAEATRVIVVRSLGVPEGLKKMPEEKAQTINKREDKTNHL